MTNEILSNRSRVIISNDFVLKYPLKWKSDVFNREIYWLQKLSSKRFPLLLGYNEKDFCIKMNYVGEPISKKNCPHDWKEQVEDIINCLELANCSHNDIKPGEILVQNNTISLIDFGWATKTGDPIPSDWPKNLGGEFKLGVHNFSDRHSIYKSIEHILKGTFDG